MESKIIEGTNDFNWGKFMVCRFTQEEWNHVSQLDSRFLLQSRGWSKSHLWVLDLQTGEGFCCYPGGMAVADLEKHNIWVCPMYEPFLTWLYSQDLTDIQKLPSLVQLVGESALAGYRRSGLKFSEAFSEQTRKVLESLDIHSIRQLCAITKKMFKAMIGGKKTVIEEIESVFKKEGYEFYRTERR